MPPTDTVSPLLRPGGPWQPAASIAIYCLPAGGFASGVGAAGSAEGVAPRSSGAVTQSPDQILVPLTVPTSLQPVGAEGFACFSGLPLLGAAV